MMSVVNVSRSSSFSVGSYGIPNPPPKSRNLKSIPTSWCTRPAMSIMVSTANMNGSDSSISDPMCECIPIGLNPKSIAF